MLDGSPNSVTTLGVLTSELKGLKTVSQTLGIAVVSRRGLPWSPAL